MYVTRQPLFHTGNLHASHSLPAGWRQAFDRLQPTKDQNNVEATQPSSTWLPQVDIREDDQRFVILADIPGIDPQQIEVSMDKGFLSITGARAPVDGNKAGDDNVGKFTRVERAHGPFHRRFALPETADAEGITASGNHGVLEISIPKKALPAPRRITINSGR